MVLITTITIIGKEPSSLDSFELHGSFFIIRITGSFQKDIDKGSSDMLYFLKKVRIIPTKNPRIMRGLDLPLQEWVKKTAQSEGISVYLRLRDLVCQIYELSEDA
ncbi:MAG: hypothetical protein AB1422_13535 [bacterium]